MQNNKVSKDVPSMGSGNHDGNNFERYFEMNYSMTCKMRIFLICTILKLLAILK